MTGQEIIRLVNFLTGDDLFHRQSVERAMRETCCSHMQGDSFMEITADERWSINMINRLKSKYPDEVKIIAENPDGSLVAQMPSSWMRIVPRRKVEMSDERRERLAEHNVGNRYYVFQAVAVCETEKPKVIVTELFEETEQVK